MNDNFHATATITRYATLSGLSLFSIPMSLLASYLIFGNYAWLNAIALLIVPFAIFCWIFTTLRAVHLMGLWFWFVPSTYVTLVGGLIAFVICLMMGLFSQEAARRGHQATDTTLFFAAAILYGGCVIWSYLYNWRRTGSAILAVSLTLLQSLSAAFVIGAINLWLNRNGTKRYENEHGIG